MVIFRPPKVQMTSWSEEGSMQHLEILGYRRYCGEHKFFIRHPEVQKVSQSTEGSNV